MVLSLVKGQKIDLTKNNHDLNLIHIGLYWKAPSNFDIDTSAFMIGQNGKIVREEDFVFYGQPRSGNGSVRLEESISTIERQHFIIDLLKVPSDVQKVSFTFTIYESDLNGYTFADVSDIQLRVVNSRRQEEIATFAIDYSFTKESAIVLGTLYRYSGEWRFHAVGAGFNGGLKDLCNEYGVEVDEQPSEDTQNLNRINPAPVSPNERFQVVQTCDVYENGSEIPQPQSEMVQLKRASLVQFNDERIDTLSHQSDELVNLFNDQEEDSSMATNRIQDEKILTDVIVNDNNEADFEAFIQSLNDVESSFLLMIEDGVIPLEKAKRFLKEQGLMIALFINTINEKAYKFLDDNLLVLKEETVEIYDEFEPLVLKMKGRVMNEH